MWVEIYYTCDFKSDIGVSGKTNQKRACCVHAKLSIHDA